MIISKQKQQERIKLIPVGRVNLKNLFSAVVLKSMRTPALKANPCTTRSEFK